LSEDRIKTFAVFWSVSFAGWILDTVPEPNNQHKLVS